MTPAILLNIPEEMLIHNYLKYDIQIIFYPFYLLQNILLSSKFTIRDNFIYPNGKKYYISTGLFLLVLFIVYAYQVVNVNKMEIAQLFGFHNKTLIFLLYFYSVYNCFGIIVIFILNIVHSHNNVLLILTIQTIQDNVNMVKNHKNFIIWNWIYNLGLMCIGMLLIVLFGIAFGYWEFTGFCVDFLFLIYDLNLIYAIRIIILLKKYLMKFKKNILVVDHLQGKDHEKVFSVYKKFMKAYNLYKKIFHALIFLHCADAFTRCLGNIQLQLEVFELKSKHLSYMLTMGGTVFFLVKNVSLGALICVHCDKFYVAIEEVETACILQLMDVHCPDSNRRLYKNMIQLNRKSFSKISACGLFNVDAALLLTLIFLHCADTVCRFLGYLQMQFELYKLQRLQFLQSCNLKNIDDTMALTATIFMEVKNFTLVILLSVHCEKFYITIEDIETVCIQRLIDVHCSDDRRKRLYKSLIQLNRDSFSKISACGLFNIDASLPLSLNLLLTNYIVVLLQFAANPPQRVSYTNCTTASYYTTLFPHYFYSFLQSYMLIFSAQPILPPDEKILRIHQDIKNIIKIFTQPSDAKNYQDLVEETTEHHSVDNIDKIKDNFKVLNINTTDFGDDDDKRPETKDMGPDSEGLILITSLVTSCIRGLHHCTSKLYSLEILQLLCENSSSETILDRILPYIIHLSQDSVPRVRARAVATCARAVSLVQNLPNADCNVFPEYILPELAARATDPSVPVRQAYANNIAKLAETAVRFLDQTQNMVDKEAANINYETELSALHEMVRSTVSYLLTDSQAVVKRALVENGITKLCIFFGKQKANDVILSHMVTFLNDKEEAALRGCFFERVVGVAAYVGYHAAPILVPLLQQGLTDQSEWIIAKALRATTNLAELGLLPKQALCDLVAESAVFLAHPNLWIRHEVCGLVSCVASLMNKVDVHCKILPLVWPHLKHKLMQVERAELLLESLAEPIPRKVLDAVLRHGDVDRLVHTLRERRNTRLKVKQGTMPQYSEMGQQLRNLFRRLASDGMTEHVENQLLAMSAHLIKIQGSSTQHITEAPGRLVLQQSGISRAVPLDTGVTETLPHLDKLYTSGQNRRTHKTSVSHETHMNTEWQHMFGHSHDQHSRVSEGGSASVAASGVTSQAMSVPPQHSQMGHSASYVQYSMAPCRVELRDLTSRMQQKYQKSLRGHNNPTECNEDTLPPAGWRPGNQLLAYLHEHKARVNQLVTLPAQRSLFGSCSDDGTVRLWDASKLQGHAHINRSKSTYNRNAGPVVSLAACEGGQSLVGATQESIFVLRTDSGSSRLSLSQGRQLESDGDEATCVAAPAQHSLIAYATLMASLVGWDLRAPGNAWKLQGDLKQGLYTCLYADPSGYLAAGTSSGAICVWDLRFLLPITSIRHPNSERVRRIISSGVGGGVWAAGERDASAWSLESTQRTTALWPCTNSVQPLHYASPASQYISSVYCGAREGNRFVVTGGSDLRLRYWDLDHPEDSYVLVHAPNDQLKYSPSPKYRSRIIDGTTVIQECCKLNPSPPASLIEDNVYRSVESRSFYHTAPITDLALVEGSKPYLVSSAADGVINVWK